MNKEDIVKKAIHKGLESKEEILQNILNVVREEEKIENKKIDLEILILELIQRKDMYGYAIIKELGIKSKDTFLMQEGEIYPILHYLERNALLESYWIRESDNIDKKYYRLTRKGRGYLKFRAEDTKNIKMLENMGKLQKIT
ncbi:MULTISPECIES: PadR family transcriptional regulator [Clostridium]|uniref:PadR family transcriptional regulator n=1 Tax=Clostridium aquiflavi TaxID=3073603 RepID=A0ABU1EGA4_9CLOT|nr:MULTISPECIES: PadR family transcriptional regulator [unclassified Clostridium]MDR5587415.1 PadR family transcriptional regulator [Clostridium sp. 5N-1]NFG63016.1 helix-turn-helix transcriptional regulator [Clostridium botulinum]NFQ08701.1 helix-turn-helix transcriptional regulator [Clostridium botulinum]